MAVFQNAAVAASGKRFGSNSFTSARSSYFTLDTSISLLPPDCSSFIKIFMMMGILSIVRIFSKRSDLNSFPSTS